MSFTRDNARSIGSKGGRTTVRKHGKDHMRDIGRRGAEGQQRALSELPKKEVKKLRKAWGKAGVQARVDKEFGGDWDAYKRWFVAKGLAAGDPMPWNNAHQRMLERAEACRNVQSEDEEELPY